MFAFNDQLLQHCTARTAWSDSEIKFDSIIKLVLVLFGECTIGRLRKSGGQKIGFISLLLNKSS